jgi:hypothetical protein
MQMDTCLPPWTPDPNAVFIVQHLDGEHPLGLVLPAPAPAAGDIILEPPGTVMQEMQSAIDCAADTHADAHTDTDTDTDPVPETVPEATMDTAVPIEFGPTMPMDCLDIHHKLLNDSLKVIKCLADETSDKMGATPLTVITITAVFSMNREFKLSRVQSRGTFDVIKKSVYEGDRIEPRMEALIADVLDCEVKVRHPTHKESFSNCFLLKYESSMFVNNHGIKVFPTGKIHTTGAVNLLEARKACLFVCAMMDILKGREDGSHELTDYSIGMMNTGFNVSKGLKLEALADYIRRADHTMHVDYDVQIRASLKVEVYLGDMFVPVNYMLYGCGKVMISGKIRDPRLLVEAFRRIVVILDAAWDECSTPLSLQQQLHLERLNAGHKELLLLDGDSDGEDSRPIRRRRVEKKDKSIRRRRADKEEKKSVMLKKKKA